jgi:phospholipid transport system substrate-binding protein
MRQIALALLLLFTTAGPATAESDPAPVVQRFNDVLLEVMKRGPQLGFRGRAAEVAPAVDAAFAMPVMARLAVGSYARQLTPAQLDQLTEAFRRFSVANYASQFSSYSGERFEVGTPRPSVPDAVVVPSRIVSSDGSGTELDYLMQRVGGEWKIVDVLAEGSVSQLAVRRSEFVSTLRRQGFEALIALLDRRTAQLAETKK